MTRKITKGKVKTEASNDPTKKIKVTSNEKKLEKLRQKVRYVFETAGFSYIESDHHTMHVGLRDIEIDMLFMYENIVIVCEDTADSDRIGHAIKKQEAFSQINENRSSFFEILATEFPKDRLLFQEYYEYELIHSQSAGLYSTGRLA